jgi:hypothetical protein
MRRNPSTRAFPGVRESFAGIAAVALMLALTASFDVASLAQSTAKKILPGPYRLVDGWPTLPQSMNGGRWGELIRVTIDKKGDIWVFHRCFNTVPAGAATCVGKDDNPPILRFDRSGRLLSSFGQASLRFHTGLRSTIRVSSGRATQMPTRPSSACRRKQRPAHSKASRGDIRYSSSALKAKS